MTSERQAAQGCWHDVATVTGKQAAWGVHLFAALPGMSCTARDLDAEGLIPTTCHQNDCMRAHVRMRV